jgi:hypothetical protein
MLIEHPAFPAPSVIRARARACRAARVPGAMQRAALLRRTGIHVGQEVGPGSAAHHFVAHCVRGTN